MPARWPDVLAVFRDAGDLEGEAIALKVWNAGATPWACPCGALGFAVDMPAEWVKP